MFLRGKLLQKNVQQYNQFRIYTTAINNDDIDKGPFL